MFIFLVFTLRHQNSEQIITLASFRLLHIQTVVGCCNITASERCTTSITLSSWCLFYVYCIFSCHITPSLQCATRVFLASASHVYYCCWLLSLYDTAVYEHNFVFHLSVLRSSLCWWQYYNIEVVYVKYLNLPFPLSLFDSFFGISHQKSLRIYIFFLFASNSHRNHSILVTFKMAKQLSARIITVTSPSNQPLPNTIVKKRTLNSLQSLHYNYCLVYVSIRIV